MLDFDTFHQAFLVVALWSSCDDNDEPLDSNFDIDDIDTESAEILESIARVFWFRNSPYLNAIAEHGGLYVNGYTLDSLAGYDLWLTMNGHGAGFWDRDFYVSESGFDYKDMFTKSAESFGEIWLTVENGVIYAN